MPLGICSVCVRAFIIDAAPVAPAPMPECPRCQVPLEMRRVAVMSDMPAMPLQLLPLEGNRGPAGPGLWPATGQASVRSPHLAAEENTERSELYGVRPPLG
jgi:hypothetical protein